ncbi:MAG: hypothetical protein EBR15_04445 [Gammaproteobacteria bacterium]|nr:hypothetical protein [Gammaproteobacteria bacterium]
MGDFDVAVRGGTVVTAADVMQCDIGIRDGRIAALADRITGAKSEIDATGLLVMPGGIDSHVHLCQNSPGIRMADDFTSGSMAAVAGGNTTIIPFATQPRGASLRASSQSVTRMLAAKRPQSACSERSCAWREPASAAGPTSRR